MWKEDQIHLHSRTLYGNYFPMKQIFADLSRIFQLQEQMLELESQVREGTAKLKQMKDSLKHEEEMQTRLSYR